MPGAERTIEINVTPDKFYAVISQFENYPQFLKEMSRVTVLSRDGDQAVVKFSLNLIKTVEYTLKLTGIPGRSVHWALVESNLMSANTGSWTLEELPGGKTRATYKIEIQVGRFVPGMIVDSLTSKTLPATLEAFKQRAERQ